MSTLIALIQATAPSGTGHGCAWGPAQGSGRYQLSIRTDARGFDSINNDPSTA